MNIARLKAIIADLPDEALVVIEGNHGTCKEATAKVGMSTKPNSMGFVDFMEDPPPGYGYDRGYDQQAVFLHLEIES